MELNELKRFKLRLCFLLPLAFVLIIILLGCEINEKDIRKFGIDKNIDSLINYIQNNYNNNENIRLVERAIDEIHNCQITQGDEFLENIFYKNNNLDISMYILKSFNTNKKVFKSCENIMKLYNIDNSIEVNDAILDMLSLCSKTDLNDACKNHIVRSKEKWSGSQNYLKLISDMKIITKLDYENIDTDLKFLFTLDLMEANGLCYIFSSYPELYSIVIEENQEDVNDKVVKYTMNEIRNVIKDNNLYSASEAAEFLQKYCLATKLKLDQQNNALVEELISYVPLVSEIKMKQESIASLVRNSNQLKLQIKEYKKLNAYMVSQIELNQERGYALYEIALPRYDEYFGKLPSENHALLMTIQTTFSSKGWFTLSVTKTSQIPMDLKEEFGGFTQTWDFYVEVSSNEIYENDQKKNQIKEIEKELNKYKKQLETQKANLNKKEIKIKKLNIIKTK